MSNRVLVVGANRGIGLQLCRLCKERGDTVVAACRKSSPELSALGVQVHEQVDVTDKASLLKLSQELGQNAVDWLLLVAGILEPGGLDELDMKSVQRQFEINALGTLQAALVLKSNLVKGSKLGILTSRMGSMADNTSGGSYGYRMSKAALNAAGRSLAHDLKGHEIAVALLHPGWVRTEMTGKTGHLEPEESAMGLIQRMDELRLENTGRFVHVNGEELPW